MKTTIRLHLATHIVGTFKAESGKVSDPMSLQ